MAPRSRSVPSVHACQRKMAENIFATSEMMKEYKKKCEEYDRIVSSSTSSEAERIFEVEKIVRKKCAPKVEQHRKTVKFYRDKMNTYNKRLQKEQEAAGVVMAWKMCEICHSEYKNESGHIPRMLPCGHTLCDSCATQQLYESAIPEIWCPYDRLSFSLRKADVTLLPVNHAVIST